MKLSTGLLVTVAVAFCVFSSVTELQAEQTFGPVECYRYLKTHVDSAPGAPLDENDIGELCAAAKDEGPAMCYERAIRYGGAPTKTAIALCRHQVIEIINRTESRERPQ